jgi:hypothetical protein
MTSKTSETRGAPQAAAGQKTRKFNGRVSVQMTSGGHQRVPQDGILLADILHRLG